MNTEIVKNSGKNIALTRSKFQIWSIFEDGGDKILKKYLTRQYCHIWSRIWGPYLKLWCRHVMLCTPNFELMEIVKKNLEIWRKESNSYFGKYITYFSKYCKDTRYIFQSRVQSMTIGWSKVRNCVRHRQKLNSNEDLLNQQCWWTTFYF